MCSPIMAVVPTRIRATARRPDRRRFSGADDGSEAGNVAAYRGVTKVGAAALVLMAGLTAGCSAGQAPTSAPSAAGASGYPLTFKQFDGSTATVRAAPTRIVTVDNPSFSMDMVVALGVKPVGTEVYPVSITRAPGSPYDSRGIPREVSDQIGAFTSVGTAPSTPDLEKIVALHPDLIVAANGPLTADLKQLQAIAPVVNLDPNAAPTGTGVERLSWVPELRLLARVLHRQPQADAFLARFAAAADRVRPALAGKSASVVFPNLDQNTVNVNGPDYSVSRLLGYLGVHTPALPPSGTAVTGTKGGLDSLSIERAGELSGQYLVDAAAVRATDSTAFLANPVIAQLPAVRAHRVIVTGPGISFGGGFAAAGPVGQLQSIPHIAAAFTGAGH